MHIIMCLVSDRVHHELITVYEILKVLIIKLYHGLIRDRSLRVFEDTNNSELKP